MVYLCPRYALPYLHELDSLLLKAYWMICSGESIKNSVHREEICMTVFSLFNNNTFSQQALAKYNK
jgi:hypothetical protein